MLQSQKAKDKLKQKKEVAIKQEAIEEASFTKATKDNPTPATITIDDTPMSDITNKDTTDTKPNEPTPASKFSEKPNVRMNTRQKKPPSSMRRKSRSPNLRTKKTSRLLQSQIETQTSSKEISSKSDDDSEATEKGNNTTNFQYSRCDLRLNVHASDHPEAKLQQTLKTFIKFLTRWGYTQAKILPWLDMSDEPELKKEEDIPSDMDELAQYFPRISAGKIGIKHKCYTQVWIAHEVTFPDLSQNMQSWSSQGHGLYRRMIQSEYTSEIEWLLYSTGTMDKDNLAEAIERATQYKVGL